MYKLLLSLGLIIEPLLNTPAVTERYGPLDQDYTWPEQTKWLISYNFNIFSPDSQEWTSYYINKDISVPLTFALEELKEKDLLKEIKYISGCYAPRPIKGTDRFSVHAYGLGCDFIPRNKDYSEEFIQVFEKYGFCSGSRWVTKKDPMHFSYTRYECWQLNK